MHQDVLRNKLSSWGVDRRRKPICLNTVNKLVVTVPPSRGLETFCNFIFDFYSNAGVGRDWHMKGVAFTFNTKLCCYFLSTTKMEKK